MNCKNVVILSLLLNLIWAINGSSQIYISESTDSEFLFGPENIKGNKGLISEFYISKLTDIKLELIGTVAEEMTLMKELEEKGTLKRREKKQLRRAKESKEIVDLEIVKIDSILNLWNDQLEFQESLIEASLLIKDGKCIEFHTSKGTYYSDELKIEIKTHNDQIEYQEVISVEYTLPSTKWVKKKADRNCISADPKDCLVWCLVEVTGGFKFDDMRGEEYTYETCPSDFIFNESESECFREMIFNGEYETVEEVVLVRNRSEEIVEAVGWKLIDCD